MKNKYGTSEKGRFVTWVLVRSENGGNSEKGKLLVLNLQNVHRQVQQVKWRT